MEYYSAIKKNEIMSFNGWTQRLSCVLSCSVVSDSATPRTAAHQAPLSIGILQTRTHWSGLPCLPSGDLSNPGIKPRSSTLQADSLPSEPPGEPKNTGGGSLSLLQGIFPTQELNQGLPHCWQILYQLSYEGSPQPASGARKLDKTTEMSMMVERSDHGKNSGFGFRQTWTQNPH